MTQAISRPTVRFIDEYCNSDKSDLWKEKKAKVLGDYYKYENLTEECDLECHDESAEYQVS